MSRKQDGDEVANKPGERTLPGDSVAEVGDAATMARGSALLFASRIAGNAGFLIAVLVLTRSLSVSHRGEFAFITTAAQVIARVASLGVADATKVFAAKQPEQRGSLLSNALLFTGLATAAVSAAAYGGLALRDASPPLGLSTYDLFLLGAGEVFAAVASAAYAFLVGCERWRPLALVSAVSPWLYAALLMLAWANHALGIRLSLEIWIAYYVVWSAALLAVGTREARLGRPSWPLLKQGLGFGVRSWVGSVTPLLNSRADQVLMGFIASQATLGVYVVAVNASEILLILPEAAAAALLPVLARSLATSNAERTLRAFRIIGVVSLVAMAVAGAFGPFLLPLVFGSNYRSAVAPFLCLLAGTLGFVAAGVFTNALLATMSPGLASIAPLASLVVGVGLDFALIPSLGATGASIAATAAYWTGGLVAFFAYRTRVPFPFRLVLPVRADLDASLSAMRVALRFSGRS
jgi:O-antigen/teichoic acid export membrane protein